MFAWKSDRHTHTLRHEFMVDCMQFVVVVELESTSKFSLHFLSLLSLSTPFLVHIHQRHAHTNTKLQQDADGKEVWICPACGKVDDGTPMIGCDSCDAWYHW